MFCIIHSYFFRCDDCNQTAEYFSVKSAREHGWAVAKNYKIATARSVRRAIEIQGEMVCDVVNNKNGRISKSTI